MRKTILLSVAGALVLCLGAPASAQTSSQVQQPADASGGSSVADPNRVICTRAEISGSRIARRVCRTAREWIAQDGELPDAR